jgi:uncharacterized protein YggU (UPF0235/DUF167 family)
MRASTRLQLRVSPGADRARVVGRHGGAWKVRVAAMPERGKANEAAERLLAEALGLSRRAVAIVSGHGARDKVVHVTGIDPVETERRLACAVGKDMQ